MDSTQEVLEKWFKPAESAALREAGLSDASRFDCQKTLSKSVAEMLAKLPSLKIIQFGQFSDKPDALTLKHLNEIVFKNRKDVRLRVWGYPDQWVDIGFLECLPEVERFDWDTKVFGSHQPLYHLNRLVHLGLGFTQPKPKIGIEFLADFAASLESLSLEGDYKKLRETISKLRCLKSIWFHSTRLEDLEFLNGLPIEKFGNYGGRVRSLEFLRKLTTLRKLWLKTNATVENVDFVADLINLERLELWYLAKIKSIPRLDNHKRLRQVALVACNRLRDISALKSLPTHVHVMASGNALKQAYVTDRFMIESPIYLSD